MAAQIGDLKASGQERAEPHAGSLLAAWRSRLARSVRDRDSDTAGRLVRSIACLVPDAPGVVTDWHAVLGVGHADICASFARMAHCLDPSDGNHAKNRFHYAAKANRPDLMPPHWIRDVLSEAVTLQRVLQDRGLSAANDFLNCPGLSGEKYYLPRFRALRHFVRFNIDPNYRASYLKNCIVVTKFLSNTTNPSDVNSEDIILRDVLNIAQLTEKIDTVISSGELDAYPTNVEKRIRDGDISNSKFTNELNKWRDFVTESLMVYWKNLNDAGLVSELYGFSAERSADCSASIKFHVNEILAGPVIGPHYHSGHRFDQAKFPILSAVYYPKSIARNDSSKAGYLEFGRPEFALPFEANRVTFRPVAGSLIIFPAFAYHGVVPIDQAPRYSINIDVYLKPESSASWEVSEFFA